MEYSISKCGGCYEIRFAVLCADLRKDVTFFCLSPWCFVRRIQNVIRFLTMIIPVMSEVFQGKFTSLSHDALS